MHLCTSVNYLLKMGIDGKMLRLAVLCGLLQEMKIEASEDGCVCFSPLCYPKGELVYQWKHESYVECSGNGLLKKYA